MTVRYWLMKSEPDCYSWDALLADRRTHWGGIRNHQAAANMKAMRNGDRAFFYHSNIGREIVGLMEIVAEAYPDDSDATGRFVMVDVKPLQAAMAPLTLAAIKADPKLGKMNLLRQSRLSVCEVAAAEAKHIAKLIGVAL